VSKRHKSRARANNPPVQSEAQQYESAANFLQALSGFEGANSSSRRGWVYWPTLDTKKELDSYSRSELLKKSRWLRGNFGLATRICRGLSEKIGYLTPLSASGDERWDRISDEHWAERACEAGVIDAAGRYDIREMQIELNAAAFGDGDILPVMVRQSTGGIMLALYEAHQIATPSNLDPSQIRSWVDGVQINKFRRHIAYGLLNTDHQTREVSVISAKDALYYCHPDAIGRIRPPTILRHAINHMIDISEILADVKLTIKVAAQLGLYIKNQKGNPAGWNGPSGIASHLRNELQEEGTPESPKRETKVEDFFKAVGGIANLADGADIGTIQDTRPHPNQIGLLNHLVRDIAWGVGVPPEILWDIRELRGANTRLLNADLDRWIAGKLLRQQGWMRRFRAIWIANEIEAGRLEEPPAGAKFWKCTWLPQASITADAGNMGKLNIEFVKNHMRSLATHYGEQGLDWQQELQQISKERKELQSLGLALNDLSREQRKAA
jgi:hypothetical protein